VAVARGEGPNLGSALVAALVSAGWHRGRVAKGWRAMLSHLTRTKKGQDALVSAGVSPGDRARNWRAWLAEERDAKPKTQQTIKDVYYRYILPDWVTRAHTKITGEIITERGMPRSRGITEAPLDIDNRAGDWSRIKRQWLAGADEDDIEDAFIGDVVEADIDFSEFEVVPGSGYVVIIG